MTVFTYVSANLKKRGGNLRDLWNNIKHANLLIIRTPEDEEREKESKNVFEETMAENIPKVKKKVET